MQLRDRGVVVELARAIALEHRADADHAEVGAFGGAERAHAGRAEDLHALLDRVEDFLVPDGGDVLVAAVDEPDHGRALDHRARDVALGGGAAALDAVADRDRRPVGAVQARTGEEDFHCAAIISLSARRP